MQADITYIKDLPVYRHEQLYHLFDHPEGVGIPETNCQFTTEEKIPVQDARPIRDRFSLEVEGFEFPFVPTAYPLSGQYLESPDADKTHLLSYINESLGFVKGHLKASKVICFDWRVFRIMALNSVSGP